MDEDGRRDLWSSLPDVIGSVANYLHRHGWAPGEPVTFTAVRAPDADPELVSRRNFKPEKTVAEIAAGGYVSEQTVPADTLAAVARLEEEDGDRYWLTFKNFYVITRYNRSPLYAMAVFELGEAIRKGMGW
jgi:membrane-bound lytic murein transglycosylase B